MGLSKPQILGDVTHNQLTGRGESNSHPITSIQDLSNLLTQLGIDIDGKMSVSDIVNDLVTGGINKPASAEMIKVLNDTIQLLDVEGVIRIGDIINNYTSTDIDKPVSAKVANDLFQFANDGKNSIATAINNRGVSASSSDSFPSLAGKIGEIEPATEVIGNALVAEVLAGKTFSTVSGTGLTGTMENKGAVSQALSANGSYTIPKGYHNGSGIVNQALTNKPAQTYTPGTANQTIAGNQYLTGVQTILGNANLLAGNIKKDVKIFDVTGTYAGGIKKISTGYIVNNSSGLGGTYAISPVCIPANCLLFNIYPSRKNYPGYMTLTESTITVTGNYAEALFVLIEFEPGIIKSKQELTITNNGDTTIAINTIDMTKSIVVAMGYMSYNSDLSSAKFYLVDNTTLAFNTSLGSNLKICVVEFY